MVRLFVYGMLLDVPGTRERFGQGSVLVAESATLSGWMMCCAGLAYAAPREGSTLPGAVLTVPTLDRFDQFEGYPRHYNRMIVHPVTNFGQTDAWVYYMPNAEGHEHLAEQGYLNPEYGQLLIRGYEAFGHDPSPIIEAINRGKARW